MGAWGLKEDDSSQTSPCHWATLLIQSGRIFKSECCVGIFRKNSFKTLALIYRFLSFVPEEKLLGFTAVQLEDEPEQYSSRVVSMGRRGRVIPLWDDTVCQIPPADQETKELASSISTEPAGL